MITDTTICALSTPTGNGAIAIVRLSGPDSFTIVDNIFRTQRNKQLSQQQGYSIHYGQIYDDNDLIDNVLVNIYKAPNSYTGEDLIEISCHGSVYIQERLLQLLIQHGARPAGPGEFTQRAFMNGKMDLTQAEAVADLVASQSEAMHRVALNQMKGGFARELQVLRDQLLHFISYIELELDFSEEDVEFANRNELSKLIHTIEKKIIQLLNSFQLGNAIKNGIPVVIAGKPNVGKSTLLNVLLNEDKAIVTEIAGTTRDVIEDVINIDGVLFRFIDTAGLREATEVVEKIGIERTHQSIAKARVIMLLVDLNEPATLIRHDISLIKLKPEQKLLVVGNKSDLVADSAKATLKKEIPELLMISAKNQTNIDTLVYELKNVIDLDRLNNNEVLVSNVRHYNALLQAHKSTMRVVEGLQTTIPTDLLAMDIRETLHYLGEITGQITTDEVLGNIFKNFCIGK